MMSFPSLHDVCESHPRPSDSPEKNDGCRSLSAPLTASVAGDSGHSRTKSSQPPEQDPSRRIPPKIKLGKRFLPEMSFLPTSGSLPSFGSKMTQFLSSSRFPLFFYQKNETRMIWTTISPPQMQSICSKFFRPEKNKNRSSLSLVSVC